MTFPTGEAQRTKSHRGSGTTVTSSRVTAWEREASDSTTREENANKTAARTAGSDPRVKKGQGRCERGRDKTTEAIEITLETKNNQKNNFKTLFKPEKLMKNSGF